MLLEEIRQVVRDSTELNLTGNAAFWADKAVCLSNGALKDVYALANALYLDGQYYRAINVLARRNLIEKQLCCRYLAAKCYAGLKEWHLVLDTLCSVEDILSSVESSKEEEHVASIKRTGAASLVQMGVAHEELASRGSARQCYEEALKLDRFCYEAWDRLTNRCLFEEDQADQRTLDMTMTAHTAEGDSFSQLQFLYEMRLASKRYDDNLLQVPAPIRCMEESSDVLACQALQLYDQWDVQGAYSITSRVMKQEPLHPSCLLVHIACLVSLKKMNDMFLLAHDLVDQFPERALSWYATGCYYLLAEKFEDARKHFSKATSLDVHFGYGWVAFGHAFVADSVQEQSNSCYNTAMNVMPGCHLPYMYVALYHIHASNTDLAEKYFHKADRFANNDPLLLHERGVLAYQKGNYQKAARLYHMALKRCRLRATDNVLVAEWEPLVNNLGHCCRKLGQYEHALDFHYQALAMKSQVPSTHSAIAFVHSLLGQYTSAIEHYHRALALNRQDPVAVQMLQRCLESYAASDDVLSGQLPIQFDEEEDAETLANLLAETPAEKKHEAGAQSSGAAVPLFSPFSLSSPGVRLGFQSASASMQRTLTFQYGHLSFTPELAGVRPHSMATPQGAPEEDSSANSSSMAMDLD